MAAKKKAETKVAEVPEKTSAPVVKENKIASEAKALNSAKVDIPKNYDIPVKSNVAGGLTFVSSKTRAEYRWDQPGDVAYLEFDELITMRNTKRKFFENNWIIIEDSDYTADEVYRALSVGKYYEFDIENLDDVFSMSESELEDMFSKISVGFKNNIANRAKILYNDGNELFDSSKRVKMFERLLGITFGDNIEE